MITDADIVELQTFVEKFYKKLISSQRKTTVDIFGIINSLGDRLASHYTVDGFVAYYRLPNTGGQIISIAVSMDAEKEYKNLPEHYCNMDMRNEDIKPFDNIKNGIDYLKNEFGIDYLKNLRNKKEE